MFWVLQTDRHRAELQGAAKRSSPRRLPCLSPRTVRREASYLFVPHLPLSSHSPAFFTWDRQRGVLSSVDRTRTCARPRSLCRPPLRHAREGACANTVRYVGFYSHMPCQLPGHLEPRVATTFVLELEREVCRTPSNLFGSNLILRSATDDNPLSHPMNPS